MKSEASKKADIIQRAVDKAVLKGTGFVRKGRNYNHKTEDGLTQVITFFVYKKYESDPTILNLEVGMQSSELWNAIYEIPESPEQFFTTSSCWALRSDIGQFKGYKKYSEYKANYGFVYFLDKGDTPYLDEIEDIIADVCNVLTSKILPMFDDLNSRERILEHAKKYPIISDGRWDFAVACIHMAMGEIDKARAACNWTEDKWIKQKAKKLGFL